MDPNPILAAKPYTCRQTLGQSLRQKGDTGSSGEQKNQKSTSKTHKTTLIKYVYQLDIGRRLPISSAGTNHRQKPAWLPVALSLKDQSGQR